MVGLKILHLMYKMETQEIIVYSNVEYSDASKYKNILNFLSMNVALEEINFPVPNIY